MSNREPEPLLHSKILILGAGHFGQLAAGRLTRRFPLAHFTVIDTREDRLKKVREELGLECLQQDSVAHIAQAHLSADTWIVPAVPVHVAFEWLVLRLKEKGVVKRLSVPPAVDSQIPNPMRVPSGTVYTSHATWICPDACNEPADVCSHTQKPRRGNLFEQLAAIKVPDFQALVMQSRQLAPGVGGYPFQALENLLTQTGQAPGCYLIATACRCHGVVDCLNWERKS